jgi:transcriptional regulator with XRE-family HTH domain
LQESKGGQVPAQQTFAGDAFFAALDAEREARRLSWKKLADAAGVSPSTLTRIGQGKRPDVDTFAKLCRWAGFDADAFFVAAEPAKAQPETLAMVSTYLRSDPNLSPEASQALDELVKATYRRLRKKG